MDASQAGPARDKVLYHLKTRGPQTAAELARRLGVTQVAVRQHLQALATEGLVTHRDERRKVGRPARLWSLMPAAARRFPDSHGDLTVELLKAVRTTFGEDGLDRLVTERSRQQREAYAKRMPAASTLLEERIDALAKLRSEEGYMAEWTREADGAWILAENHCPICAAATVCQGFCRDELSMFRDLLGSGATVERGDHILAGARRCAYRIEASTEGSDSHRPPASATVKHGSPREGGRKP
jgi:predicted ArsR family transcriptional regulator